MNFTEQEQMDGSSHIVKLHGNTVIQFQFGPVKVFGINGCRIDEIIDVLVARLEGFQKGPFRCRENSIAITHLEDAKLWLMYRTTKRIKQNVEGTNAQHV